MLHCYSKGYPCPAVSGQGRVWEGMDVHRGAGTMDMSSGNQGTESMARVWMSECFLCV